MANTKPHHVFLCHASEDKPIVRELYNRLSKDGINIWLDEEKLLPGQDWQLEISKAVKNSEAIIVCLSSRSVNKAGFVQKEIKLALDVAKEKPEGTIYFIPVRLDECPVPDTLKIYHWVNLFEDRGYEKIKQALQTRIEFVESEYITEKNVDFYPDLAQITIIIEKNLLQFTEKEKDGFIYAISKLTGVSSNQIRILRVAEGSVIVTLEMPKAGAQRLIELYYENDIEIKKLRISKVTLKLDNKVENGKSQKSESKNYNVFISRSTLVKDIMTPVSSQVIISPSDTVEHARQVMKARRTHSVLIPPPSGGKMWRIFTETDFLMAIASGDDPSTILVESYASVTTQIAAPEWTIEKALEKMINSGVKHLPVMDKTGNVVGLISSTDIANYL